MATDAYSPLATRHTLLTRREWRLAVLMRDHFRCRWGPLFSASPRLPVSASPSPAPPIGSVWPGPQGLLFPLVTGLFSALR